MRQSGEYIPNYKRAVITGAIATVYKGERIVRVYNSGDPLIGEIPQSDAPPWTGYVRRKKKK